MSHSTTSMNWIDADHLPERLPIFPLSGIVLLPRARLPLNVFEPRYLTMTQDVLAMPERMIGIVQPSELNPMGTSEPPLYQVGCAGRITSFNETEDGRFLISLTGISRFIIQDEIDAKLPYRIITPNWAPFSEDFEEMAEDDIDRDRFLEALRRYFKINEIVADWNAVMATPTEPLVSSLVMSSPLAPNEKQALLESPNLVTRTDMLTTLMEMATFPRSEAEGGSRH